MRHRMSSQKDSGKHLMQSEFPSRPPFALFKNKGSNKYLKKIEPNLSDISFNVYKFNSRPKPKKNNRIVLISCLSEFGCETLGCMYCIPRLLRQFPGQYIIAVGWYGREYLYRHLVDEFWEIDESFMWLRDYTRAFHHISDNLKRLEESLTQYGTVMPSAALGKYVVSNTCRTCGKFWHEWRKISDKCPACNSTVIVRSMLTDIAGYKPSVCKIPKPSQELMNWAKQIVKSNTVGIFARGRTTYGRNLTPEFYINLIKLLESKNYNIIWLGEKQSTLPCPLNHIIDFSRMPESRDLEKTLAIICQLKFTIQFWTASTRLAGMMGVPFLLFESPEQIYSSYSGLMSAQEGKRLELTTFGSKKLVICHYHSVMENQQKAIDLVDRAIKEMNENNWDDIIGLVEDEEFSRTLKNEFYEMLT